MFITFEGQDGAGKTTQLELLRDYLESRFRRVTCTREPGGNRIAESIRALLLDTGSEMDDMTEAYLYAAARAEHVRRVIKPALRRGEVVLCDRYVDSSVAYQGYGRGLTAEVVCQINRAAVADCMPCRTYLLALPQHSAFSRVRERGLEDRIERAGAEFASRVSEGFMRIAREEPDRFCVLDAARPIEEIAAQIAQDVERLGL